MAGDRRRSPAWLLHKVVRPDPRDVLDLRLAAAAGLAWCVTAVVIVHGWRVGLGFGAVSAAIAVSAVVGQYRWRTVSAAVGSVAAAAAVTAGFCVATALREHAADQHPLASAPVAITAVVVLRARDDPRPLSGPGPRRVSLAAEVVEGEFAGRAFRSTGLVTVLASEKGWGRLVPGQMVRAPVSVFRPQRADLSVAMLVATGPPDWTGPPGTVQRVAGHLRADFAQLVARTLDRQAGGLLPGLAVGDTSGLQPGVQADFRASGLTHLLAVSGGNVAIVLGAVLLLARAASLGPVPCSILAGVVLVGFVILVRPSPSVLRAAVMGGIGLLAVLTSRRRQAFPALAVSVLGLLIVWPQLAVDFGFALSVVATAALIVFVPAWVRWLVRRGWPELMAQVCAVPVAAALVTTPIIATMTGRLSLVSVVANILVAPIVSIVTVLGVTAVVATQVWPPLAEILVRATGPMLEWMVWVSHRCATLPGASMQVTDGAIGAVGMVVFGAGAIVACWAGLRILAAQRSSAHDRIDE